MKRNNKKFTFPSKYILLGMTMLCVGMIFFTFTFDISNGPFSAAASYVIVPLQKGVNEIGLWFSERSDELKTLREVMAENKKLQEQIDLLSTENNILQQDKYELARLRALYDLDEKYPSYEKVGARIIGKDPGNWFNIFTIDKGANDGLAVNMNVIAGSGLVGRIIAIGPTTSTVLSIIDDTSNVSAMVLSTSDRCSVQGDLQLMNENKLRLQRLDDKEDKVQVGDKIITSDISDKYLQGIVIGYVDELIKDSNNLTKSGTIRPAVDFSHLQEVLVILDLKKQNDTLNQ